MITEAPEESSQQRAFAYRILRYTPNLVRDEWVNIGVLVFDPQRGERRLRLIEEPAEYARVRRLHPEADESLLRALRDDLEDRFQRFVEAFRDDGEARAGGNGADWLKLLGKWDDTLSNVLQLAPQKGVFASDLDAETERVYAERVAPQRRATSVGAPGSRAAIRNHCDQVWKQARLWERIEKGVRLEQFTFPGDPMRIDYAYRKNGTRGFVQTLSVSREPGDARSLAYAAERIRNKVPSSEFTAVTDVLLRTEDKRHNFVRETLRDVGIEAMPAEGFAVWVHKLRPTIQ